MAVGQLPEVIAAPYTAWVAPVGTVFPKLSEAEGAFPSAWKKLGTSGAKNYSEGGITVTHGQTHGQFISAGGNVPRKKWRTEETGSVQFELVDLSVEQYALIMDNAKVEEVTGANAEQWIQLRRGTGPFKVNLQFWALLLRGTSTLNEEKEGQYEFATVCQAGAQSIKYSLKQGPAMLLVQFDALEFEANKWIIFRQAK